jgi:hypothetical protein
MKTHFNLQLIPMHKQHYPTFSIINTTKQNNKPFIFHFFFEIKHM